jgi:hypothetical protein
MGILYLIKGSDISDLNISEEHLRECYSQLQIYLNQ